jgi:DNA excision repair protein ERCC-3
MTVLLDVHADGAEEARAALMPFAELEKSPEHIHTYRITPLSLWNAAAAGFSVSSITDALLAHSRYDLPGGLSGKVTEIMSRFGKLKLYEGRHEGGGDGGDSGGLLFLESGDPLITLEITASRLLKKYMRPSGGGFLVPLEHRGTVKWELIKLGYPVEDCAPLIAGERLDLDLRTGTSAGGAAFTLRDYQREAADALVGRGGPGSGYGIICLPCGSGKTLVGMAVMAALKCNTLILTANTAAVHQWIQELTDKTTLTKEQIAEYTGGKKESAPVTIATYQIVTWRGRGQQAAEEDGGGEKVYPHFRLFRERAWGLIIYDEVHLLPAPVFRVTAELQAVRRLGLTATLVREDGAESAVFSLVGPKRYDVPWKELEQKGWIAEAFCVEIRAEMPKALALQYAVSDKREKYRVAAENPAKIAIAEALAAKHRDDFIIVIGQYLDQLEAVAQKLNAPLITGKTPNKKREEIYGRFRQGELRIIVVSKVANFAIDLPDASMAIEISGSFGSRQEEAQRLGRILRPKQRNAFFYTVVSRRTVEEDFAQNRQKFLAEQGYKYAIQNWADASICHGGEASTCRGGGATEGGHAGDD